jgi:hypothetical protein
MRHRSVLPVLACAGLALSVLPGGLVQRACAQPCTPAFADNFQVPGVNGPVYASIMYDAQDGNGPRLVIGGQFSRAGGKLCNGVAVWTGTEFAPLGGGVPQNNLANSGSGTVRALAVLDPDGAGPMTPELWVGGSFTRAQQPSGARINASGIARWNGATQLWSSVARGSGELDVYAFLADEQTTGPNIGPRMYVATNSNQSPTPYLMAYQVSGAQIDRVDFFSADFTDIQSIITTLAKHDGRVYFGGYFDDGVRRISLDGTQHEPLPSRPTMALANLTTTGGGAGVGAMISYQGRLLIAPLDPAPAGSMINTFPLESFNGTSWQPETFGPLGSTVFSSVGSMSVIDLGTGPKLYFGGSRDYAFNTANFETPAGLPEAFNGGAVWDGTTLSPLGGGFFDQFLGAGSALTFTRTTLRGQPVVFTGGVFEFAPDATGARVQGRNALFWNGAGWTAQYAAPVNGGFTGNAVVKLDGVNPRIVNNGSLDQAIFDPINPNGIPQYDGSGWSGSTVRSARNTTTVSGAHYLRYDDGTGEALFAFGNTFDAPTPLSRLAKYNPGTQGWDVIGANLPFPGSATSGSPEGVNFTTTVFDTDGPGPERPWLIVAGDSWPFAPGFPAGNTPNIYAFTGSQWVVLGSGLPDTGNENSGFGTDSRVVSVAVFDDGSGPKLYASGTFTGTGGNVARYDGTGASGTWTIIGTTTAAFANFTKLRTLDLGSGPALYAFGVFSDIYTTGANPVPTGPVARWTGTGWVGLQAGTLARTGTGGPITPYVSDLASFDDGSGPALYAAGPFGGIGGVSARGLARYNGSAWSSVGLGLNSFNDNLRMNPSSLVVFDDDASGPTPPALYISGFFDNAGGTHSHTFARYGCPRVACAADIAGAGQVVGADGELTADDIIVFIGWFFAADARADVAGAGQTVGADGQFTADDIILFINRFFAGC